MREGMQERGEGGREGERGRGARAEEGEVREGDGEVREGEGDGGNEERKIQCKTEMCSTSRIKSHNNFK